jgi:uncharacterized protein YfcZ (UPF0381/DUF406 family)
MKSFKSLLSEVAQPKPEEEKRFKNQHTVEVGKHPVAPEDQHKGIAKPKAKRKADQEGDADYDKAYVVKEAADVASPDESSMAMDQAKFISYVADEIKEYISGNKEFPEWMQNKLTGLHEKAKDMHAVMAGKYDESVNEGIIGTALGGIAGAALGSGISGALGSGAANAAGGLATKMGAAASTVNKVRKLANIAGRAAPAIAGAYIGNKTTEEELSPKQKKIDHNKNGKIDGHDLAMLRSKKKNEEVEQIDELSNDTLRNYHGAAALDLRKKREKLAKGTLTTKDHKQGQNRVTGLNRAANKMEEVELDEAHSTWNVSFKSSHKPQQVKARNTAEAIKKASKKAQSMHAQPTQIPQHKDVKKVSEEVELDEAFKAGILKFKDKSSMVIKKEDADIINSMMKNMSANSRKKMEETAMKDKAGFADILSFAKEAM